MFTAVEDESLSAVGLYAVEPGVTCQISIYLSPTNGPLNSSVPATTQTATLTYMGYSTISLTNQLPLKAGQAFSVVVQFTGVNSTFPLPVETPIPNYASKATASAGQSYVSSDGINWTDLTTVFLNTNICIKAFTISQEPPVAEADSYQATQNTPLQVSAPGVLGNDLDPLNLAEFPH